MSRFENLTRAAYAVGEKHLSLEALTIIRDNLFVFSDTVQQEFRLFMTEGAKLFGPAEEITHGEDDDYDCPCPHCAPSPALMATGDVPVHVQRVMDTFKGVSDVRVVLMPSSMTVVRGIHSGKDIVLRSEPVSFITEGFADYFAEYVEQEVRKAPASLMPGSKRVIVGVMQDTWVQDDKAGFTTTGWALKVDRT